MKRLIVALAVACAVLATPASAAPRVAVLIVVDQLRAADIDRLSPLFEPDGFGGMEARGAHVDLRYSYAVTETGPGHATIATGANPPVHGISANRWWIGTKRTYSAADPAGRVLGAPDDAEGRGPAQLRAGTLGDALKVATSGRGRVLTLSHKDRAAILTGGHSADLAAWYDPGQGWFTTSTAYATGLPTWLSSMAAARIERANREGTWEAFPSPVDSHELFPVDDVVGEDARLGGRVFPHDLFREKDADRRRRDYRGTPQALGDIFALGRAAIENERLGADAAADLLVLGVSSADYVGHWFGPQSLEMVDILRRLDRHLRRFHGYLHQRFGPDGYVLAVTGDHGGLPLPERVQQWGVDAGRIHARPFFDAAEAAIVEALPKAKKKKRLIGFQLPHLWLDLADLSQADQDKALAAARASLGSHEGIAATYLPAQLPTSTDPFAPQLLQSLHPGRTGQILLRPRPRWFIAYEETGSDHGSPYAYDGRVPLFLAGAGVKPGRYAQQRDPRDVAPTIAWLMRLPPPESAQGTPIDFVTKSD
jgi:predicted AlkP superfamily pyrophosphatase or phosphodiesterase